MLLAELVRVLGTGEDVVLATVIATAGSTPVPAGTAMFLSSGIPVGTVGGGCVEADVIRAAQEQRTSGKRSAVLRFTLDEGDIESGMLCGGTVEVLVESLQGASLPLYERLHVRCEAGEDSVLLRHVDREGFVTGKEVLTDQGSSLPQSLPKAVEGALRTGVTSTIRSGDGLTVVEPIIGMQDLFVFGGGHVSRFVVRSAAMAGFRVTVVDDRPEYANAQRFPEAWRTLAVPFDRSWEHLEVRSSASVVIVTRGHKFDERVLERAVQTPARYIGMIGSATKVASTFDNLRQREISEDRLRKVRAPIGLAIGARTAEEIGISITAELIAVRRGVPGVAAPMSAPGA
jgi:xanthine dehydrogenase accessory factor